jgi:hypothetical protein
MADLIAHDVADLTCELLVHAVASAGGVAAADTYCCAVSGRLLYTLFVIRAYLKPVFCCSNRTSQRHWVTRASPCGMLREH